MKKIFILFGIMVLITGCDSKNITEEIEIVGENQEESYTPKFEGSASISIETNGDYTLKFNVNNEGIIYYVIQPWYNVTKFDLTANDIEAGKGQEFVVLSPEGKVEQNPMYVVSAKGVDVFNHEEEVIATGYLGDIIGSRPPEEDDIQYSAVIWYVFKDIDGNYSDVLMLAKN